MCVAFVNKSHVLKYLIQDQERSGLMEYSLSRSRLKTYSQQLMPTLKQFLELASRRGKVVIFDLREPPVGHLYHRTYINITLDNIVASGIQHDKVRVHVECRCALGRSTQCHKYLFVLSTKFHLPCSVMRTIFLFMSYILTQ